MNKVKIRKSVYRLEREGFSDPVEASCLSLVRLGGGGYEEAVVLADGSVLRREAGSDEWTQEERGK